jgi:nucleoside-diphosphate-sugar epimerase
MNVLITGATGTAGSAALSVALRETNISKIRILVRKTTGMTDPKLEEIIHSDFEMYPKEIFEGVDAVIWDLGISQNAVSKDEYIKITYSYAMAAAETFFKVNPSGRFCFLSGQGTDQTEKTFTLFGKIKGLTERELSEKFGERVFHFRPGYIEPMRPKSMVGTAFVSILNRLSDKWTVNAEQLAICMLGVAKAGSDKRIFENNQIRRFRNS